ncbi:MAG TPA: hypothetical protein VF060_03855 [Trebonia sp.]
MRRSAGNGASAGKVMRRQRRPRGLREALAGDAWLQIRPLAWAGGWPVTGAPMVPVPGEGGG